MSMMHLEPVTRENLDAVLALKVNKSQIGFVSTTAESLAQAYVYAETAFPFTVCDDQDVIGFIILDVGAIVDIMYLGDDGDDTRSAVVHLSINII